jgi:hypothetical protein
MEAFPQPASRNRKGRIINAGWVCLLLAGCNAQSPSNARVSMSSKATVPGSATVTLEARLEAVSKDSVAISYGVRNLRPGRIYVFNTLFHTDDRGNRTPDPGLAYVISSGHSAITVGKFLIPIPQGMKAESAEMPYLDPLEAGQVLAGKISLQLPLHAFSPYYANETELSLAGGTLLLQIGFVDPARAAAGEALIEPAKGAGAGHFDCDYGLGLRYQETLQQEIALTAQVTR